MTIKEKKPLLIINIFCMNKISTTYNPLQLTTRHIHYNIVHFTLLLIKVGSPHISLLVEVFFSH